MTEYFGNLHTYHVPLANVSVTLKIGVGVCSAPIFPQYQVGFFLHCTLNNSFFFAKEFHHPWHCYIAAFNLIS